MMNAPCKTPGKQGWRMTKNLPWSSEVVVGRRVESLTCLKKSVSGLGIEVAGTQCTLGLGLRA